MSTRSLHYSLFLILCITIAMLASCTAIGSIKSIYNKDVNPEKIDYKEKSVVFIPIVHFGQEVFYKRLKDTIVDYKGKGYKVFYEEIANTTSDVEEKKKYLLKWRKINGEVGKNRESYNQLEEAFEGGVVQPEYSELGIDSNDVNADVELGDLINKYEEIYGEVLLVDCDYATALDSSQYDCSKPLKNDLKPVILHYRNRELANRVIHSSANKIVIIYGQDHLEGVKEILEKE